MSSIVLEEEFDENYEPTQEEVEEYARFLGMEPEEESDLLWIAKEALKAPLPPNWKPCQSDDGNIYYFNFASGESIWDHPCDEYYKKLYKTEKAKRSDTNKRDLPSKPDTAQSTKPPTSLEQLKSSSLRKSTELTQLGPIKSLPAKLGPLPSISGNTLEKSVLKPISNGKPQPQMQPSAPSRSGSKVTTDHLILDDDDVEDILEEKIQPPAKPRTSQTKLVTMISNPTIVPKAAVAEVQRPQTSRGKKYLLDNDDEDDFEVSEPDLSLINKLSDDEGEEEDDENEVRDIVKPIQPTPIEQRKPSALAGSQSQSSSRKVSYKDLDDVLSDKPKSILSSSSASEKPAPTKQRSVDFTIPTKSVEQPQSQHNNSTLSKAQSEKKFLQSNSFAMTNSNLTTAPTSPPGEMVNSQSSTAMASVPSSAPFMVKNMSSLSKEFFSKSFVEEEKEFDNQVNKLRTNWKQQYEAVDKMEKESFDRAIDEMRKMNQIRLQRMEDEEREHTDKKMKLVVEKYADKFDKLEREERESFERRVEAIKKSFADKLQQLEEEEQENVERQIQNKLKILKTELETREQRERQRYEEQLKSFRKTLEENFERQKDSILKESGLEVRSIANEAIRLEQVREELENRISEMRREYKEKELSEQKSLEKSLERSREEWNKLYNDDEKRHMDKIQKMQQLFTQKEAEWKRRIEELSAQTRHDFQGAPAPLSRRQSALNSESMDALIAEINANEHIVDQMQERRDLLIKMKEDLEKEFSLVSKEVERLSGQSKQRKKDLEKEKEEVEAIDRHVSYQKVRVQQEKAELGRMEKEVESLRRAYEDEAHAIKTADLHSDISSIRFDKSMVSPLPRSASRNQQQPANVLSGLDEIEDTELQISELNTLNGAFKKRLEKILGPTSHTVASLSNRSGRSTPFGNGSVGSRASPVRSERMTLSEIQNIADRTFEQMQEVVNESTSRMAKAHSQRSVEFQNKDTYEFSEINGYDTETELGDNNSILETDENGQPRRRTAWSPTTELKQQLKREEEQLVRAKEFLESQRANIRNRQQELDEARSNWKHEMENIAAEMKNIEQSQYQKEHLNDLRNRLDRETALLATDALELENNEQIVREHEHKLRSLMSSPVFNGSASRSKKSRYTTMDEIDQELARLTSMMKSGSIHAAGSSRVRATSPSRARSEELTASMTYLNRRRPLSPTRRSETAINHGSGMYYAYTRSELAPSSLSPARPRTIGSNLGASAGSSTTDYHKRMALEKSHNRSRALLVDHMNWLKSFVSKSNLNSNL